MGPILRAQIERNECCEQLQKNIPIQSDVVLPEMIHKHNLCQFGAVPRAELEEAQLIHFLQTLKLSKTIFSTTFPQKSLESKPKLFNTVKSWDAFLRENLKKYLCFAGLTVSL